MTKNTEIHYPKISVVMPVYNVDMYIKYAIESILNQTFSDFEFIIVDDGSTDDSYKIIEEYSKKDNRIIALRNEKNLGISETRNIGTKFARGKYIAISDADDISIYTRFEKQYDFLEKNKDCGVVGSFVEVFDGRTGNVIGIKRYYEDDANLRKRIFLYCPVLQPATMIRKEVYDNIGYYDTKCIVAGDLDFWFRLGTKYKFANIQEVLLRYRIHKNSVTSPMDSEKLKRLEIFTLELREKYSHGHGYSMTLFDKMYNMAIRNTRFIPYKTKFRIFNLMRNGWLDGSL